MNREDTFECKDCGHQFPKDMMDYEEEDLCIWCVEVQAEQDD